MIKELLAIGAPGIRQIVAGKSEPLNDDIAANDKTAILTLWDQATADIGHHWSQIAPERFHEDILMFGRYQGTVWWSIFYFIDNEIHHRAQGYVYLRSLGFEPPFFWER